MRNNKEISEERLEEMLKNYCRRQPKHYFKYKADKAEEKTMKRKPSFKYAAVTLCILLMLFSGFAALQYTVFSGINQNDPPGFFITAYAAEPENGENQGTRLDGVSTKISQQALVIKSCADRQFDSQENQTDSNTNSAGDGENTQTVKNACQLGFNYISLEVSGDNITSYDISTDNGEFNFVDTDEMEKYKGSGNTDRSIIDKYFHKGQTISGIPVDKNNPYKSVVTWYPSADKLFKEISNETGLPGDIDSYYISYDIMNKFSPEIDNRLHTAEDYTKYFGTDISITVHYNDGTSELGKIHITLDENGFASASVSKP